MGKLFNSGIIAHNVESVNGQTGKVVITKSDIGLGNVDNTSDMDKPISTATQAALDDINSRLVSAFHYRGSVATYADLPSTNVEEGDVYNIVQADPAHGVDAGDNVVWVEAKDGVAAHWDVLSGIVDLSIIEQNIANLESGLADEEDARVAADETLQEAISAQETALAGKQDTLVSGTNIKTVNGNSLLGSGNVDIDALPSQTGQSGKFLTTDGTSASWANVSIPENIYTSDNLVQGNNIEIIKKVNPYVIDSNTFALFHYNNSIIADAGVGSTFTDYNTYYTRVEANPGQLSLIGAGTWGGYTFVEVTNTVRHFGQNVGMLRGVDDAGPRCVTIDRRNNSAGYNFSGYIATGAITVDVWAKSDYDNIDTSVVAFSLAEEYDKTRAIKFRKNSVTLYADADYNLIETNVLKTESLSTPIVFSDWNHYAFTYVLGENTCKCYGYVNGKCVLSYTDSTPLNVLRFGCSYSDIPLFGISTGSSSNSANAYLQELRIQMQDCYGGQDFNVPTQPYTTGEDEPDVYQINNTMSAPSVMTGATASAAGTSGLVPAPAAGDQAKYLTGAGTWEQPSGLQNTATGTSSLTILGTASTGSSNINIGVSSQAISDNATAIGKSATAGYRSTAVGSSAKTEQSGIAIGSSATALGTASVAIGASANTNSTKYSVAIGLQAITTANRAIQIGTGTNSTANTLSVGLDASHNYQLLDATGTIPAARLPSTVVQSTNVTNIVKLTQAEYDALATKDENTFYVIYTPAE